MSLFYSSRFSTKVFSFFGIFCETTRWVWLIFLALKIGNL